MALLNSLSSVINVVQRKGQRLNPPNPKQYEYVNVLEETNLNGVTSSEQLGTANHEQVAPPPLEGSGDKDGGYQHLDAIAGGDMVYDEVGASTEDLGNFSRQSVVRQSLRLDAGRSINNSSRLSIRSESGAGHSMHHNVQQEEKPVRRSARSEMGRRVQRGHTDPSFTFQPNEFEMSESTDGFFQEREPLSIHQLHKARPVSSSHKTTTVPSSVSLGDIPAFKDPETLGDGSGSLERFKISLPPDIYSSQILSTVKSPELQSEIYGGEEQVDRLYDELTGPVTITQRKSKQTESTESLDGVILLETVASGNATTPPPPPPPPPAAAAAADGTDECEVVYDQPMVESVARNNSKEMLLTSPGPLFDDPGYDKGFMGQPSISTSHDQESNSHEQESHVYQILEQPPSNSHDQAMGGEYSHANENIGEQTAAKAEPEMKGPGSVALLEYQEEELQDLDQDMASYLVEMEELLCNQGKI